MDMKTKGIITKAIRAHLGTVPEDNAKGIAKATRYDPDDVLEGLAALRKTGEVECKAMGRGKGFSYWLTTATAVASAQPEEASITGSRPSGDPLSSQTEGPAVEAPVATVKDSLPVAPAADEINIDVRSYKSLYQETKTELERYTGMFNDTIVSLARIDEALGLGEDGIADPDVTIEAINELKSKLADEEERHAQLQSRCFDNGGQSVFDEVKQLREEREALTMQIEKLQAEAQYREGVISDMRAQHEMGKFPFYVSIGSKREGMIHKDIEVATRRIESLVKSGDKEGFVLVPIRKAVKGVKLVELKNGQAMEARAA